ncbi:hypothetical protein L484_023423 [Morus notabilis]|uniref:Uncharacterized protein n=1 Tax=Morus notabilis TaxID=981085 RepID=W9RLD8_9ROSA|nr:hypothetical protein L484_023423 [Morus notabilis]
MTAVIIVEVQRFFVIAIVALTLPSPSLSPSIWFTTITAIVIAISLTSITNRCKLNVNLDANSA